MAPQDSQNCGRNLRKRKQSDAEFAGNSLLHMVIIDIVINVLLESDRTSCRYCIALEVMLLFLVSSSQKINIVPPSGKTMN